MSEQRFLYRIEDAYGFGPFQNPYLWDDLQHYNDDVENYPTPANDPGLDVDTLYARPDYRFWEARVGCCSREQLQHWFDPEFCRQLAEMGYLYVTVEVPDEYVAEGDFQAVYDAAHAEVVSRLAACALWETDTQMSLPLAA